VQVRIRAVQHRYLRATAVFVAWARISQEQAKYLSIIALFAHLANTKLPLVQHRFQAAACALLEAFRLVKEPAHAFSVSKELLDRRLGAELALFVRKGHIRKR